MGRSSKLLYLLLFICFYSFSQEKKILQGVVFDTKNNPLFNVSVQLIENATKRTISYTSTNEKGMFYFVLNNDSINKLSLKITHLGYEIYQENIKTYKRIKILLNEQEIQLKEIRIKSSYKEFEIKKDTITFNLAKIRDSTETRLKDLVEKLPGLDIDKNKKISFQGRKIDKVLIDGEDFFGKKHEMSTENIPSDAVKGIEIIENFKEFDAVGEDKGGKIVLNVSLFDGYKNKFVGNIEVNAGIKDKYQLHSNIFKFIKKGNIALITEFNNTGESAINMIDYIEMQGGIGNFVDNFNEDESGVYEIDHSKLPRYVLVDKNVHKRNVFFNSLNYVHKFSDRIKLNGYLTIDKTNHTELQTVKKRFINDLLPNSREEKNNVSKSFLGNSFLNFVYKKSKNQSIKYQLKVNPFKNEEFLSVKNNNILDNSFENRIKDDDFTFGQSFTYQNKFSNKWRLKSVVTHDYKENKRNYTIHSNKEFLSFLFLNNNFNVLEKSKTTLNSIVVMSNLYYKKNKKITFDFSTNYQFSAINLEREVLNQNNFFIQTAREQYLLNGGLGVFYKLSKKIKVSANIKYSFNTLFINKENENYYWLLPKFSVNYKKNNNRFSFSYSKTKKNISIYDMQKGKQIIDYQTILLREINFWLPKEIDNYSITLNNFKSKSNRLLTFIVSYFDIKNQVNYNTSYSVNYIKKELVRTPEKGFNAVFYYSKRLKFIPFGVNAKFSFGEMLSENRFNNLLNKSQVDTYQSEISLLSKFKKKSFQTKLRIDYSFMKQSNSFEALNYNISSINVSQSFNGKILKNIIWKIGANYKAIKATTVYKDFFAVNFLFKYSLKNKRVYFFLKGNNVFHTINNQFISQNVTTAYSRFSIFEKLKGYVLIGVKLDF